MKLLPLSNDFVFKAIFARKPDLLLDLLNSFPEFSGERKIKTLQVLNPEIPQSYKDDKHSILDIQAENILSHKFLIEMQASHQSYFPKRVLYYWSKAYSRSIKKGQNYDKLPRIYSINISTFTLFPKQSQFHLVFQIKERKNPEILLTEDFEIHILELPKLKKNIFELQSTFEEWMFLLKSVENLKEVELKTLERKNPKVKKVISELRVLSQDEKTRLLYEERLKANLDYNSGLQNAFTKGRAEGEQIGIQKGKTEGAIESLYLGIELALENKFNFKGLALLPKVKKNKDLTLLKKILEIVLKSKDLEEVKIFLSKKKV
jgi:predicted transposase/invertase (TIGR01784 family)